MATETLEPTAGGGGGIDKTPRPVDFDNPDDPRSHVREAVVRALSDIHLRRYGGPKPGYSDRMLPELSGDMQRRIDVTPITGGIAIDGFNIFESEQLSY